MIDWGAKFGVHAVPGIRKACNQLILVLAEVGPSVAVDMDNATCRESLDVIGAPLRPFTFIF